MEVVFPQAKELKNIVAVASAFLTEGTFKAEQGKLSLISVDPSSIAIVITEIYEGMALDFNISEGGKFTINLDELKKILTKAKTKEQAKMVVDKQKNKFYITLKGKVARTFSLPLIEDDRYLELPNIDLDVKLEMDAKAFAEIISSAKLVGDELRIEADPEKNHIRFIVEGELKGMKIEISSHDEGVLSLEIPKKVSAKYSVDYLYKLVRVANISDTVIIKFDQDKPIWLDYVSPSKFRFGLILAPREG